ncbi:MAG: hypothetical protein HMLKMBBP_03146 [Planctomycetes bacterium]|nr:hypothetical protein [Planctomycetota bacterium]
MTNDPSPYRFAARALAFAACAAAAVAATDRALVAMHRRGIHAVPKIPPPEWARAEAAAGKLALFGDSVLIGVTDAEKEAGGHDALSLAGMIAKRVPLPVADLSRRGRGPAFFAAMAATMRRESAAPAAAILPVNLRTLGPVAARHPMQQEADVVAMLRTGWCLPIRLAAVFRHRFGVMTDAAFLDSDVSVRGSVLGSLRDVERPHPWFDPHEERPGLARSRRLVRYAFDMDPEGPVRDVTAVVRELRSLGVPLVVYLTPIDMEGAAAALSGDEMAAVRANVAKMADAVRAGGAEPLDLTGLLPRRDFVDLDISPGEHLTAAGRTLVAERVAREFARLTGK